MFMIKFWINNNNIYMYISFVFLFFNDFNKLYLVRIIKCSARVMT